MGIGASALIEKGKSSEQIGQEAAGQLLSEINSSAAVGGYLQDQLIPFMALLGPSALKVNLITAHTRTNVHIVEQFLPVKFTLQESLIKSEQAL